MDSSGTVVFYILYGYVDAGGDGGGGGGGG